MLFVVGHRGRDGSFQQRAVEVAQRGGVGVQFAMRATTVAARAAPGAHLHGDGVVDKVAVVALGGAEVVHVEQPRVHPVVLEQAVLAQVVVDLAVRGRVPHQRGHRVDACVAGPLSVVAQSVVEHMDQLRGGLLDSERLQELRTGVDAPLLVDAEPRNWDCGDHRAREQGLGVVGPVDGYPQPRRVQAPLRLAAEPGRPRQRGLCRVAVGKRTLIGDGIAVLAVCVAGGVAAAEAAPGAMTAPAAVGIIESHDASTAAGCARRTVVRRVVVRRVVVRRVVVRRVVVRVMCRGPAAGRRR